MSPVLSGELASSPEQKAEKYVIVTESEENDNWKIEKPREIVIPLNISESTRAFRIKNERSRAIFLENSARKREKNLKEVSKERSSKRLEKFHTIVSSFPSLRQNFHRFSVNRKLFGLCLNLSQEIS